MDCYHIWCDLRESSRDLEFADNLAAWLELLRDEGRIAGWRLTRRKLGFGPPGLGEMHVTIETDDLAQLDRAFELAASRTGDAEVRHSAVFSMVRNAVFSLERDFPDPVRSR